MAHIRRTLMVGLVTLGLLLPLSTAPNAQAAQLAETAAGLTLVKDINTDPTGWNQSSYPGTFADVNGTLFFTARDGAYADDALWKSDGTAAGTVLVKDGEDFNDSELSPVAVIGDTYYFQTKYEGGGGSLWKSDGTTAGTSMIADVSAADTGAPDYNPLSNVAVAFQGKLFFASNYSVYNANMPDSTLWSSDGTAAGTAPIVYPGSEGKSITELLAIGDTLYFVQEERTYNDFGDSYLSALYRSDGTTAGTQKLLEFPDGLNSFYDLAAYRGKLYFAVSDSSPATSALWTSDGTVVGTVPVATASGEVLIGAGHLLNFNDLLVFTGSTAQGGIIGLWRSDGTAAGTYRIKYIYPDANGGFETEFTVLGNLLFFFTDSSSSAYRTQLWRSDGTKDGTFEVDTSQLPSAPRGLVAFDGALYFEAYTKGTGTLWRSDGTAAGTEQLIVPSTGQPLDIGPYDPEFIAVNNTLFVKGDDGRSGYELWKLTADPGRVRAGLQARYDFNEGAGTRVHDGAGVGTPLDLTIKKASQVRWGVGSLQVTGFTSIASSGPATSLINAAKASDAVTVEAWVTPAEVEQYAARILTISPNATVRNLTLAQGSFTKQDSTLASLRVRTSTTASSGQEVFSPTGSFTPGLTHLVGTVTANGVARIYVNGVQVAQAQTSGTLDNWNTSYRLILAGDLPSGRGWRGTYHLLALYDRALSAAEVQQNYAAGPEAP